MVVLRDYGACCATGTGAGSLARRRPCQKMFTRRRRCLNIRVEKETSQRFSDLVSFTATLKKINRKILNQHDMRGLHQSHLMSHSCERRRGSACVHTVCLLFLSNYEARGARSAPSLPPASTTSARACSPHLPLAFGQGAVASLN